MRFISGDIAAFVRSLRKEPGADIWLVGGGQVSTVMLNEGLVNEVILTMFPLALGESIPLFAPSARRALFKTAGCETYEPLLIQ